jgi:hypothetical protein
MATEYIVKRAGVNMKEVVTVPRIRYTTSLVGKSRENIKVEEHITEADVILSRELKCPFGKRAYKNFLIFLYPIQCHHSIFKIPG